MKRVYRALAALALMGATLGLAGLLARAVMRPLSELTAFVRDPSAPVPAPTDQPEVEALRRALAHEQSMDPAPEVLLLTGDLTDSGAFAGISIDQATAPAWAAANLQGKVAVQGNLDPWELVAGGDAIVLPE